jgi:predicted transcriptional regulator
MPSKHDQILQHIEELPVGHRISVRRIARQLTVSEGTAYRAIKEAEGQGLVTTIERVGTVRIERKRRQDIDRLTYAEVLNIVDGSLLGGRSGLHKTLHKFVIGAMEIDAMLKYVDPGSLVIVGNRAALQRTALEHGAAVLVTGGFGASAEIVSLADAKELPVVSSAYDTFTVATMINRAIYDRMIKKEILLVADIMSQEPPVALSGRQTVADYLRIAQASGHSRFPVLQDDGRVVGVVAAKDVYGHGADVTLSRLMSRALVSVAPRTSVAAAAHMMVWEGLELLPVIDARRLVGVISRQDVIKALQYDQRQPQIAQTVEDIVRSGFGEVADARGVTLTGVVTPQMTTTHGGLSSGAFMTLVAEAGMLALRRLRDANMLLENAAVYFLKPVQLEDVIEVTARVLDAGRKVGKVDVEMRHTGVLAGKAMLTIQLLER